MYLKEGGGITVRGIWSKINQGNFDEHGEF